MTLINQGRDCLHDESSYVKWLTYHQSQFIMNQYIIYVVCSALLVLNMIPASAQDPEIPAYLGKIAGNDRSRYQSMILHHPSGLLNNYDLKYHRFHWLVDPSQVAIRGSVTSYYTPTTQSMTSIQFELAQELSADSAYHRGFKLGVIHNDNLVTVNFGEIIPQGILDSLTIYYHGAPPNSGFGSFGIGKHNGVPALWTLSEPYGAKDWWPSKNDLTDKIDSIDVFVAAPNGNRVASNGVLLGEAPYGPNLTVTHWKHRHPIVSYLIAIAVTNYAVYTEYFSSGGSEFPIVNYVYPEDSANCSVQTANLLPVYAYYGNLFGNYPFENEKYGHAEFGWGGGMEHQTMTFIGHGAFNIEILSHELAHQWFGDMVTCGSWHDIWINEGFATYCAGLMYEHFHLTTYWPVWKRQNISFVTYQPDGSVYCDDTTNVGRIFDPRLSYSKGAMVLHQLRWIIGDSAFFTGLRNFLEDPALRHGFALTEDFQLHMEASSGQDLDEYFSNWIYKQGYPSYQAGISQESGLASLTLHQTQSSSTVSFFRLPVPMRYFGEGKDTLIVFDHTFSGQVFEFNPGFKIDSVHFDPDYWLISANNQVALGVDDLPAGKYFRLSPNPASDYLEATHNLGCIRKVVVSGLNGAEQKVIIVENNTGRLILATHSLGPGIYFLKIGSEHEQFVRKFIIVR